MTEKKDIDLNKLQSEQVQASQLARKERYQELVNENNQLIWKIVRQTMRQKSIPPGVEDGDCT